MRPWVEYLLKEPAILNDFLDFCEKEIQNLLDKAKKEGINGNLSVLPGIFGEIQGLERVCNKVKLQLREERQHGTFQQTARTGS